MLASILRALSLKRSKPVDYDPHSIPYGDVCEADCLSVALSVGGCARIIYTFPRTGNGQLPGAPAPSDSLNGDVGRSFCVSPFHEAEK